MKLGIDIRHLTQKNPSGIGQYTIALIQALAETKPDAELHLFASGTNKALQNLPPFPQKNITVHTKTLPNKLLSAKLFFQTTSALEDFLPVKIDHWLFPNLNHIRTRLPYTITVHDVSFVLYPEFFTQKSLLWHKTTRPFKLLSEAKAILAVSNTTKQDITHFFQQRPEKIHVTHLGVSNKFNPKQTPADQNNLRDLGITGPYFLCLATQEPRKNIDSVVIAYQEWQKKHPNNKTTLVIAGGKGWKTSTNHQNDNIIRTGYVPESSKPALIRHANALFFPSFYEGFGLPVLEALASQTPDVASFTGSLHEIDVDSTLYIDPYNLTDLINAFTLIQDQNIIKSLKEKSTAQAQKFSWTKTAQKTWEAIER